MKKQKISSNDQELQLLTSEYHVQRTRDQNNAYNPYKNKETKDFS